MSHCSQQMCGNTHLHKNPELEFLIQIFSTSDHTAGSQSSTELFFALDSMPLLGPLEVNRCEDGNIYNCPHEGCWDPHQ